MKNIKYPEEIKKQEIERKLKELKRKLQQSGKGKND